MQSPAAKQRNDDLTARSTEAVKFIAEAARPSVKQIAQLYESPESSPTGIRPYQEVVRLPAPVPVGSGPGELQKTTSPERHSRAYRTQLLSVWTKLNHYLQLARALGAWIGEVRLSRERTGARAGAISWLESLLDEADDETHRDEGNTSTRAWRGGTPKNRSPVSALHSSGRYSPNSPDRSTMFPARSDNGRFNDTTVSPASTSRDASPSAKV